MPFVRLLATRLQRFSVASARSLLNASSTWCRPHLRSLNRVLLLCMCLLAVAVVGRAMTGARGAAEPVELDGMLAPIRDIVSVGAAIVAGISSYYVFLRGRTLQPRAAVRITLREVSVAQCVAIVRFNIRNIGRIRLSLLEGQSSCSRGEVGAGSVKFQPMHHDSDILRSYRKTGELLELEPGDEINIDTPIVVRDAPKALILIRAVFTVNKREYKENAIFCLENAEGYK